MSTPRTPSAQGGSEPGPPHAPILDEDAIIEGTIVSDPHLALEISLNGEESRIIEAAARAANLPMGRYIKQFALETACREQE